MKLFLKNLLFTFLIYGTVSVYVPLLIVRGKPGSSNVIVLFFGILLLLSGIYLYLWTVWDFATAGKGTPLPLDAPKKLVVRGLYRYMRNPMYLGVVVTILGWAVLFIDGWLLAYAVFVWLLVHLFVLLYEEPTLARQFGADYAAYRKAVSRWLPHKPGPKE